MMKPYKQTAMDKKQDKKLVKGKPASVKKAFFSMDAKMDKPTMSAKQDMKKDKAILKKIEKKKGK